uniref:Uncharacterized protein n=1 Tax=Arundo donax TaxID=35708 RepID=A0A0A8Y465_ARUDO
MQQTICAQWRLQKLFTEMKSPIKYNKEWLEKKNTYQLTSQAYLTFSI